MKHIISISTIALILAAFLVMTMEVDAGGDKNRNRHDYEYKEEHKGDKHDDILGGKGKGGNGNFVDEDGDGVCDNFVDEDGDGKCDHGTGNCDGDGNQNRKGNNGEGKGGNGNFVDEDGDGVCDNFVDEDGDGKCDHGTGECDGEKQRKRNHKRQCWREEEQKLNLFGNAPNPFDQRTRIRLNMEEKNRVHIELFDLMGNKVKDIYQGELNEGDHDIFVNPDDIKRGMYYYRITTDKEVKTGTMMYQK